MSSKLEERLEEIRHARSIAADQIHTDMTEEDQVLLEAETEGLQAQIDYLESVVEEQEKTGQ